MGPSPSDSNLRTLNAMHYHWPRGEARMESDGKLFYRIRQEKTLAAFVAKTYSSGRGIGKNVKIFKYPTRSQILKSNATA